MPTLLPVPGSFILDHQHPQGEKTGLHTYCGPSVDPESEHQDPVVGRVSGKDPTIRTDDHAVRGEELGWQVKVPLVQHITVGRQGHHSVIGTVRHKDPAGRIHRNA